MNENSRKQVNNIMTNKNSLYYGPSQEHGKAIVLILVGYSDHDVNECLNHIKLPISLHMCALWSKLPSNISKTIWVKLSFCIVNLFVIYFSEDKDLIITVCPGSSDPT